MKKKIILFIFIIISSLIILPSKVKALNTATCDVDVVDITSNSAKMKANCSEKEVRYLLVFLDENYMYNDGKQCDFSHYRRDNGDVETDGLDFIEKDGSNFGKGKDEYVEVNNLAPGSIYLAAFRLTSSGTYNQNDEWKYVCFQTSQEDRRGNKIDGKVLDSGNSNGNKGPDHPNISTYGTRNIGESENVCDEEVKAKVRYYWNFFMILAPIGLIILISGDFVKAIASGKPDALQKSGNNAVKRTIACVLLLMLPFLLSTLFDWFGMNFCF